MNRLEKKKIDSFVGDLTYDIVSALLEASRADDVVTSPRDILRAYKVVRKAVLMEDEGMEWMEASFDTHKEAENYRASKQGFFKPDDYYILYDKPEDIKLNTGDINKENTTTKGGHKEGQQGST